MFSSTDPSFLGMLPTSTAESFEFVFPPQGPGMHRVMLCRLSLQIDNHVLFGAWAREVNDLLWEKYFQKCNQYYEVFNDWLAKWPSPSCYDGTVPLHARDGKGQYDGRPIVPYSAFGAAGHHNGIMMTEGLAKTLFRLVEGGKRFQYNQNSFAAWHDGGLRADDTFKLPKKVYVTTSGGNRVKPYASVLTLLSQCGKIVAAVWKTSMSHAANRLILPGLKIARDHVGAPPLRLLQTDNSIGEQAPYYEVFPELEQGTVARASLPMIEIPPDDIVSFDVGSVFNAYILTLIDIFIQHEDQEIYYGLDTEFERDSKLTVLSLAFPQSLRGSELGTTIPIAIVIHLHKIGKEQFPADLKRLLELPSMIPTGRLIGGDCKKLEEQYGIKFNRMIELGNLCRLDNGELSSFSLCNLMKVYLQCMYPMNKSAAQLSSYAKPTLTPTDKQYCALDAVVSLWVFHRTVESLANGIGNQHPTLQVGKRCTVTHNAKDIAFGHLIFVGAGGEQMRWGGMTLGRRDCLVAIESLIDEDFEPKRRNSTWPATAETMRELHNNVPNLGLAVAATQVRIHLDGSECQPSSTPEMLREATIQSFQVDKSYLDVLLRKATEAVPMEDGEDIDLLVEGEETVSSSGKSNKGEAETGALTNSLRDLFHQLHCLPLSKESPATAHVLQLVLVATLISDKEDYANVVEVLQNKGKEDVAVHEFHNRGYWRDVFTRTYWISAHQRMPLL
ncbi:unnamed protein product [Cylindrotheca closterium]|uniref:Uncharacterized protein n=1 Tax=Cylindrotheca closterium TaxID=2856 RepID=A0AAD2FGT7_9STRA|nr:unnamed protein product [Cylindrotheca closterium]